MPLNYNNNSYNVARADYDMEDLPPSSRVDSGLDIAILPARGPPSITTPAPSSPTARKQHALANHLVGITLHQDIHDGRYVGTSVNAKPVGASTSTSPSLSMLVGQQELSRFSTDSTSLLPRSRLHRNFSPPSLETVPLPTLDEDTAAREDSKRIDTYESSLLARHAPQYRRLEPAGATMLPKVGNKPSCDDATPTMSNRKQTEECAAPTVPSLKPPPPPPLRENLTITEGENEESEEDMSVDDGMSMWACYSNNSFTSTATPPNLEDIGARLHSRVPLPKTNAATTANNNTKEEEANTKPQYYRQGLQQDAIEPPISPRPPATGVVLRHANLDTVPEKAEQEMALERRTDTTDFYAALSKTRSIAVQSSRMVGALHMQHDDNQSWRSEATSTFTPYSHYHSGAVSVVSSVATPSLEELGQRLKVMDKSKIPSRLKEPTRNLVVDDDEDPSPASLPQRPPREELTSGTRLNPRVPALGGVRLREARFDSIPELAVAEADHKESVMRDPLVNPRLAFGRDEDSRRNPQRSLAMSSSVGVLHKQISADEEDLSLYTPSNRYDSDATVALSSVATPPNLEDLGCRLRDNSSRGSPEPEQEEKCNSAPVPETLDTNDVTVQKETTPQDVAELPGDPSSGRTFYLFGIGKGFKRMRRIIGGGSKPDKSKRDPRKRGHCRLKRQVEEKRRREE